MTTKNKIKLEFTKKELVILANALDILMIDLEHTDDRFSDNNYTPDDQQKKYFKSILKLNDKMFGPLAHGPAHKLRD